MGVSLQDVHVLLGLWKDGHLRNGGKVMELGSQEMHLPFEMFEAAVKAYGVPGYAAEHFQPWEWETRGRCCFAGPFYRLLGFSSYTCLDINGENQAVPHDLNIPLEDTTQWNRYDLVTDFGCAEHAFNVSEAFRTMHRLCRPGGLIVSHQAVRNGNGYYLFEPAFYEDLAAANGYEILFCAFSAYAHHGVPGSAKSSWLLPLSLDLINALDGAKMASLGLIYALKKTSDEDFKMPYQGKLMSVKYSNSGYETTVLGNYARPAMAYAPVLDYAENISTRKFKRICKAYFARKLAGWFGR